MCEIPSGCSVWYEIVFTLNQWIERQKLHSLFPEVVLTFTVPLAVARLLSRSFHLPRSRPTASVLQAAHFWGEKILDETNTKGIHQHQYQSHPTACVFEAAQVLVWGEVINDHGWNQYQRPTNNNTKGIPTTNLPKARPQFWHSLLNLRSFNCYLDPFSFVQCACVWGSKSQGQCFVLCHNTGFLKSVFLAKVGSRRSLHYCADIYKLCLVPLSSNLKVDIKMYETMCT